MITIHNSSLAFTRAGYVKPEQVSIDKKQTQAVTADDQNRKDQVTQASTPDQIQAAITKTGLTNEQSFSKENGRRTNLALQAYNQNRNQAIQTQLESIISRVDYYA